MKRLVIPFVIVLILPLVVVTQNEEDLRYQLTVKRESQINTKDISIDSAEPQKRLPERHQDIDLSGIWIDNGNGMEVTLTTTGSHLRGSLWKATYIKEYRCSRGKREQTDIDFDEAKLNDDTLVGRTIVCVYGHTGVADGTVKMVPIKLTLSTDRQSLNGTYGTYGGRDDDNTVGFTRCSDRYGNLERRRQGLKDLCSPGAPAGCVSCQR